eukprot:TRINITY_DN67225_c8_g2_i1.p2 TRINITY_DN67225_c8_g2~~TRINITY_DN67225_c8_g2_i1.p2  ORF type:complete len:102 (+),score=1.26 TRINITY_DN67225_c8_g2_i1:234-539(+)
MDFGCLHGKKNVDGLDLRNPLQRLHAALGVVQLRLYTFRPNGSPRFLQGVTRHVHGVVLWVLDKKPLAKYMHAQCPICTRRVHTMHKQPVTHIRLNVWVVQ